LQVERGYAATYTSEAVIGVITNPNSGKNRRDPDRLRALDRVMDGHGLVRRTRDPSELRAVIEEFFERDCDYWVCDGGDGTLHWMLSVAHQVGREIGRPWPLIVPANGGTIDFVASKAGVRGQVVDIVKALVEADRVGRRLPVVELDTLHATGQLDPAHGGAKVDRIGFAVAVGGVAQNFFDKLYQYDRIDGWKILDVILRATAGSVASAAPLPLRPYVAPGLQRYADEVLKPMRARVDVDGQPLHFDTFSAVQIGSIDINLGGIVRTFRHAARDGVLHAQALGGSALGVVMNLPNVVLGTPIWGEYQFDGPFQHFRATAFAGETLDPVFDGEMLFGLRELEIRRGPKIRIPVVNAMP